MPVTITQERPDCPEAAALITELAGYLQPLYPRWNQFGLSPAQLVKEGVLFFIARVEGEPAGCGGLKPCDGYAELKRMYVRPRFRGRGLGKRMLRHLEEHAAELGYAIVRLETGIYQPEAMDLYEQMGYREIPPFPPYTDSTATLSRFYEKRIVR